MQYYQKKLNNRREIAEKASCVTYYYNNFNSARISLKLKILTLYLINRCFLLSFMLLPS